MDQLGGLRLYGSRPSIHHPRQKKRAVILLELLIALGLTAILITALLTIWVNTAKLEHKLEKARVEITQRASVQTRLQNILSNVDGINALYTEPDKAGHLKLFLRFDNGIDPTPAFSGKVKGTLFLDAKGDLCLSTWPKKPTKKTPVRTEILLSNVKKMGFEFLGDATENKPYVWVNEWPKQDIFPPIMKLTLDTEERLYFAFFLPDKKFVIKY